MNLEDYKIAYENVMTANKMLEKELDKFRPFTSAYEMKKEIERLNNIISEIKKEVDRLLERQYESERFAKEQGFDTYLPAKENLLCVKNKLKELEGVDKE